jgi:hypothetical protein
MKYGKTAGNKREVAIGTAHTDTVNSLNETNKQTNKQTIQVSPLCTPATSSHTACIGRENRSLLKLDAREYHKVCFRLVAVTRNML